MKEEEFVFKKYATTVKGAAEWTVKPYVYWGAKRGFGFDELSAYMLPENWRQDPGWGDSQRWLTLIRATSTRTP